MLKITQKDSSPLEHKLHFEEFIFYRTKICSDCTFIEYESTINSSTSTLSFYK